MNKRVFSGLACAGLGLAALVGCEPANDTGKDGVKIEAPGVGIEAGKDGVKIDAPGVKVESDSGGTKVETPGADLEAKPK